MAPMSSIRPNGAGFQAINAPAPLDALSRVVANGQNTFSQIVPPASAPAGPPAPPAGSSPAPSSTVNGTDLSADPILAQIKALGQKSVGGAAASGLAGAKNDLINYGSVDVPQQLRDMFATQTPSNDPLLGDLPANPVLAALNDAGTAQAAAGNPFSTSHQLASAHETNQHNIDQTANLANLFYSSTHANQLGDENQAYLGAQNGALQQLAQALSGENSGLLGALGSAHDQYLGELPAAYQRAITAPGATAPGDGSTPPPPGDATTTPPPGAPGGARTAENYLQALMLAAKTGKAYGL